METGAPRLTRGRRAPDLERMVLVSSEYDLTLEHNMATPGIISMIEERRALSTWHLWNHESQLVEDLEVLERMIGELSKYQSIMQASPSWKRIALLCDIEESFCRSPGLPSQLIRMLARDVDDKFAPVPSLGNIDEFFNYITDLQKTSFGSIQARVMNWADMKRWNITTKAALAALARSTSWDTAEPAAVLKMYQDEFGDFVNLVSSKLYDLSCMEYVSQSPVLKWLSRSFYVSCLSGDVDFLSTPMWSVPPEVARQKSCMHWAAVGYVLENNMEAGLHKDTSLKAIHPAFSQIVTITFPEFITNLVKLKGVMVSQRTFLRELKQKILAAAMAAFLASIQFGIHVVEKRMTSDGNA